MKTRHEKVLVRCRPEDSQIEFTASLNLEPPTGSAKLQLGSGLMDYYLNPITQKTLSHGNTLRINMGATFAGNTLTRAVGIKTRGTILTGGVSLWVFEGFLRPIRSLAGRGAEEVLPEATGLPRRELEHTLTAITKEILVSNAAMFALNGFEAQLAAARAERRSEKVRLERMKDQLQKKMQAASVRREDPQARRANSN